MRATADDGRGELQTITATGQPSASDAGRPPPFPEVTPNQDGAGVIDAVGEGVKELAVGDRVWIYLAAHNRPTGTAQQFTNLPANGSSSFPMASASTSAPALASPP